MTANGVVSWVDPDGDGIAVATLNAGAGATDTVTSATIVDGAIVNADINTNAAIALSKLATDPLARANHTGTQLMATISDAGSLATKSAVASADITDGTIVSGDLNAAAGITSGQLAGSIAPSQITGTAVTAADAGTVTSTMITDGTIVNGDLNAAAAIALSKLATDPLARANHTGTQTLSTISDAGTLAGLSAVASAQITDGTIVGGDLSSTIVLPSAATATTQAFGDNSAKAATTAYVDTYAFRRRDDYYLNGSNANVAWTYPRGAGASNVAPAGFTTGTMYSSAIVLYAGQVITSISFKSGSQNAVNPTHWGFALYDTQATPALIAQSTDQTTTAWATSTVKTLALGSPAPYTVATTGVYYVSVWMAAGTMVNLKGSPVPEADAMNGYGITGVKVIAQTSGSSLTTTAPSTITAGTVASGQSLAAVS